MRLIGFIIGAIIVFIICIAFDYYKYKKHFKNLLDRHTKKKIKLDKRVVRYTISKDYFEHILYIIVWGCATPVFIERFLAFCTLRDPKIGYIIFFGAASLMGLYYLYKYGYPIIKNEIRFRNNNYYFLEDIIEEERQDDAGLEFEFFVHFKKCIVPTKVPAIIADSTKVGDEIYILVIKDDLFVFSKNYYELDDKTFIKERYEPESNIEGRG